MSVQKDPQHETSGYCENCGPPVDQETGVTLHLRHLVEDDREALHRLYDSLSDKDRYLRFFSGAQPTESFYDSWTHLEDNGGFGLVLVRTDADGETIVGDAGYSLVADGDGELGIAVDPAMRGGTGPWLLEALLAHAHERGLANLQAVVKAENRGMLAIARRHGCAVLGRPDFGIVKLTMGTNGPVPSWPPLRKAKRVLIESNRTRTDAEGALRGEGFEVLVCSEVCREPVRCPLLKGEGCPMVDGADAVVIDIPPEEHRKAELLQVERRLDPDGVIVEVYDGEVGDDIHATAAAGARRRPGAEVAAAVKKQIGAATP